ncbi:MAG: fasciclin domain-containing protein [Rhizobiales bacterium]|nr:fasciclin domain-containing protein [Hyphomicrobiales bacterium]
MTFRKSLLAAAASAALGISALASPVFAENPMVGGSEMFPEKNIVENAVNSKDHTTLVAAVKAGGLVDTLSGAGPFTVFAPTNEAFAKLPAGTVDTLLKPENKDQLTKVLTYHVVPVSAMSDAINKMIKDDGGKHEVKTVSGDTLTVMSKNDKIMIMDESGQTATVTQADVKQSNGVIHVIDTVLLPK